MVANRMRFRLWAVTSRAAAVDGVLRRVTAELSGLAGSTEREFLHVGEQLQEIVTRAKEQRSHIAGLLDTVAEGTGESLSGALDGISRWTANAGAADAGAGRFRELKPVVRAVCEPLQGLKHAVRALRFMGVVTRVESARLGAQAAGFDALAAEVTNLADAIDGRSNAILDAVKGVSEVLRRTENIVMQSMGRQREEISVMAAECAESLEEMRQEDRRASEVTRSTHERYDAFAEEVGNIVAALQSHDSARQAIDHIVEALSEAAGCLARGTGDASNLIELQAGQLARTGQTFVAAVEGIRSDLERLAKAVDETAREARGLLDGRGSSRQSWIGNLQRRFVTMASAVSEWAQSRNAITQAAAEVQQACSRMSGFVTEIEGLGDRMLLLALNAEIQAVHLAETGVVMESVAEGIRATSQTASAGAREAGHALRRIETATAGIREQADDGAGSGAEVLAVRIRQLAAELESADAQSAQILASIAAGSETLSQEVGALRASITAGRTFDETVNDCLGALAEIAGGLKRGKAVSAGVVAHAASKYTMHAEREVHAAFVGATAADGQEAAADASGLGENVELF